MVVKKTHSRHFLVVLLPRHGDGTAKAVEDDTGKAFYRFVGPFRTGQGRGYPFQSSTVDLVASSTTDCIEGFAVQGIVIRGLRDRRGATGEGKQHPRNEEIYAQGSGPAVQPGHGFCRVMTRLRFGVLPTST